MIGIVTASGDADETCRELLQAAQSRGGGEYLDPIHFTMDFRAGRSLLAGRRRIREYDALILRGFNRSGDIDFQFEAFEMAQEFGVPVVNSPQAINTAESKPVTIYLLAKGGVPVPRTIACQTTETARAALQEMGQAVIKPLFGALGVGVERVRWPEDAGRLEGYLEEYSAVCMQEYIEASGRDIRAFVVGGRILGAVLRIAQGSEWRTNVHQGGHCESYCLSPYEQELALRSAALIGLEYTGVDILPGPHGPVVLEVNGAPQWHGLASATGLDVAGAVVSRALDLSRQRGAK